MNMLIFFLVAILALKVSFVSLSIQGQNEGCLDPDRVIEVLPAKLD